jgi:hypothetical protein
MKESDMKIAILGTGMVGDALGTKLVQLGHEVRMGSRTKGNVKAIEWVKKNGAKATEGTFADAAKFGEIVLNCTSGVGSLEALKQAGSQNLKGKILIDVANPLDFSKGMPPTLTICNTDSLGEQIQKAFPETKVVKTLNTTNCLVMVNPSMLTDGHDLFISGNDAAAKAEVTELIKKWFGWKRVIDLGDITTSRGTEMLLAIWIRLMVALKTPNFNFKIVTES